MISLVTACMNRESHLRHTLPAWLKLPDISEFVLVDWSTREPFDDLLALDPRIRIIRAVDEPKWVLAYAYNLGVSEAKGDVILKCDADCLPDAAIVSLQPAPGRFYAGNWRAGNAVGKTCANGQCVFTRAQWEEVNGYSEVIRRYGFDDEDFYERLKQAGHSRTDIDHRQLEFLRHSDEERVVNSTPPAPSASVDEFLNRQLHFQEAINRMVAGMMPWGRWFTRAAYSVQSSSERLTIVRRDVTREIPISPPLQQLARSQAIRLMTSLLCKIPTPVLAKMDEAACLAHLSRLAKSSAVQAA
ncbi:MAG: galactosyltransferase-related protein [Opitutus sp.]|nr:galactosyltransferase-related protein [Opitutus sp.]